MKRLLILICLLFACSLLFSEIKWIDFDKNDERYKDYTALAVCSEKSEVLEITHLKSLDPYFISYQTDETMHNNKTSVYLVTFTKLGIVIYEYVPNSKTVGVYAKSLFQE